MDTNTRYLQIRGKIEISQELDYGSDVPVIVTVTDIQHTDNQDGTINTTYKAKLFSEDE